MPIRTCVGCRERLEQAELVRIRATPDGLARGRGPGRGAYVCPDRACLDAAIARKAIGRALRTAADADDLARLQSLWPLQPDARARQQK
ncbi:MAG: nucleic acid-binding protein [Acidimicrobiaceae bacterium]|nr:nucleic acid-binding protein [Acidimicrobiaceae bacterium]MAL66534.1 nucleic acid-binding protein [Acidimicrobiaceae bacterium]